MNSQSGREGSDLVFEEMRITWNCECGDERLWVSESSTICLRCDTEKHGFQAITKFLDEVIRGN